MTNIVFVCTGNTCRSPMAEAILKSKNIDGIEVRSAGIFAADGAEMSAFAKEVLKENQMNHKHRSSLFIEKDVQWADLILTMTQSHKDYIAAQFPSAAEKTFTLKEFVEEAETDVHDPFGGNLHTYRTTFAELNVLISKLEKKLKTKQE